MLATARQPAALLAIGAAVFVIVTATFYSHVYRGNVVDDALISLNYAKNIALGHGAVFNVGERVEGYTCFLWVVVLVPFHWLSRATDADFVAFAVKLGIVLAAANVVLVYAIGRRLWGERNSALLAIAAAVGLCAADNSFAVWAALGMEKHLVGFWLLAATYASLSRHRHRAVAVGVCLAALQMTRPDAALFGMALTLSLLIEAACSWLGGHRRRALEQLRQLVGLLAVWLSLYAVYFGWRYGYYGQLLPNTYYVKLDSASFDGWSRGLDYLDGFLRQRGYTPLIALVAALWLRNSTVRALWLWAVAHVVYVTYAGGDFYPGHRFFVFLVPVIALLTGQVVHGTVRWLRGRWLRERLPEVGEHAVAALGVVVALALLRVAKLGVELGPFETEIKRWGDKVETQRRGVLWLASHAPAGSSIFAGRIGSMGLYTDLHVFDFFGITDRAIAHQQVATLGQGKPGHEKRASLDYVLSKAPTYVVTRYQEGADLWMHGYMYDADVPLEGGLWVRAPVAHGSWKQAKAWHFEVRSGHWTASGSSFAHWPSERSGRVRPFGSAGRFITSYSPSLGDDAIGALRSSPFELVGELMTLRVAGGHDPERLRVSLMIDGERMLSATGRNSHAMSRRVWQIDRHRGRRATIEIVDHARGGWGHIIVDEIVQWQKVEP